MGKEGWLWEGWQVGCFKGFTEELNVGDVVLAIVRVEVFCSEPREHVSEATTEIFKGQW